MIKALKYNTNTTPKKIVLGLSVGLATLFVMYGYFVNATIINIVERKAVERDMGDLVAVLTDLEVENGELRKHITYEYAHSIGYVQPKEKTYASSKRLVGAIGAGY